MMSKKQSNPKPEDVGVKKPPAPPPPPPMRIIHEGVDDVKFRCRIGLHKYRSIGHLYNNHIPVDVAIYKKCELCGHVDGATVIMAALERITD